VTRLGLAIRCSGVEIEQLMAPSDCEDQMRLLGLSERVLETDLERLDTDLEAAGAPGRRGG